MSHRLGGPPFGHGRLRPAAKAFFEDPAVKALGITINNGFRTIGEALRVKPTKGGKKAENPYSSLHPAGLAFDANGVCDRVADWQIRIIAANHGFEYGYRGGGGCMHFEADPVKLGYGPDRQTARYNAIVQNQLWYYNNVAPPATAGCPIPLGWG